MSKNNKKTVKITRFDGGVTKDLREQSTNKFKITKNFDNFSDFKRLQPFRALEADETDKDYGIVQFIITNNSLYGLGRISASDQKTQIYVKTGTITSSIWVTATSATSGTGARKEGIFFEYKNYLYSFASGYLQRWGDLTGSPTFDSTYQALTFTDIAQPVHHPADDIAYFFTDNKVHKLNGSSWTSNVLTLPDNLIITSATAYGNYLAIGCKSKKNAGSSTVFLWDRDSSVNTISQKIDWGRGDLVVLETINDILVGVSNVSTPFGTLGVLATKPKLHIKGYTGSLSLLQEIDIDSTTTGDEDYYCGGHKVVSNDKLFFDVYSGASADAKNYTGIWSVGVHESGSPFATTLAYKVDTDANSDQIQGFNIFGDYLWVAHSSDGSVEKTNNSVVYADAVYESYIFNDNDSSQTKNFIGATVMTEPQPTGGTTVLKYKKDNDSSWTTLFTNTTDDDIRKSVVGTVGHFKEIQFRIESTGGTVITGFKFTFESIDNDIYES